MGYQISPLVILATENLKAFNLIASPLKSDNNSEINSKLPEGIKPDSLKQTIFQELGTNENMGTKCRIGSRICFV
jgi:hypothetical protein